jgi:hypothetical protein
MLEYLRGASSGAILRASQAGFRQVEIALDAAQRIVVDHAFIS